MCEISRDLSVPGYCTHFITHSAWLRNCVTHCVLHYTREVVLRTVLRTVLLRCAPIATLLVLQSTHLPQSVDARFCTVLGPFEASDNPTSPRSPGWSTARTKVSGCYQALLMRNMSLYTLKIQDACRVVTVTAVKYIYRGVTY